MNKNLFKSKNLFYAFPGSGVLFPIVLYILKFSPPFLSPLPVIVAPLSSILLIIIVFNHYSQKVRQLRKKVFIFFVLLMLTLLIFLLLFNMCTVVDPWGESRFQIGFDSFDWSLTERGLKWKKENPTQSIEDWMLSFGAFREGGPHIIWTPTSIYAAGFTLNIVYILFFVCWTYFWAVAMIYFSIIKRRNQSVHIK